MAAISKYGWVDIDWTFSNDEKIVNSKFYLADDALLEDVLANCLGNPNPTNFYKPMVHPRWPGLGCMSCNVVPIANKGVQANDDGVSSWSGSINMKENIRGGCKILCCFKPLWTSPRGSPGSSGSWGNVVGQGQENTTQVMSVISNQPAAPTPESMKWSDGRQCSNIRGVVKVVPKTEFWQKQVLFAQTPSDLKTSLVGCVNSIDFLCLDADQTSLKIWPAGTVLVQAMTTDTHRRYDDQATFDILMRFSAITLKDKLEDGSIGYVGWQRLYDVNNPAGACWNTVKVGVNNDSLYPTADLNTLSGA